MSDLGRRRARLPADRPGTVILDSDGLTKAAGQAHATAVLLLLLAAPLRAHGLRSDNPSAVDALVGALAVQTQPSAVVLTSDPADIESIVSEQPHVRVVAV